MKSVCFFPFTHITQIQAGIMGAFFNSFQILNLDPGNLEATYCRNLVEKGRLKAVSAGEQKIALLDAKVSAFREWAALHKGNERNLKALIREKKWMQDDTGVASIQSQIRQGQGGAGPKDHTGPEDDPWLLLRFAEILDAETLSIRRGLRALEVEKAALFAELKGEIDEANDIQAHDESPFDLQEDREDVRGTGDRIRAWCNAAAQTRLFDSVVGPVVLATTSKGVADFLQTNSWRVINGLDIDSIKVHEHECSHRENWQKRFDQALDEMALNRNISRSARSDWRKKTGCNCHEGGIRILHFPDGDLNKEFNIPGKQVFVCLVALNS